jgi:predicted  nucleic acid-binding Zn-ribbon protein
VNGPESVPSVEVDLLNPEPGGTPESVQPVRKPRTRKRKEPEPGGPRQPAPALPAEVQDEFQNLARDLHQFRDQLRAFQEEFQGARSELEEIRTRAQTARQEVEAAENTVRELRQTAQTAREDLEAQAQEARRSFTTFHQDQDRVSQEMNTLRAELNTLPLAIVQRDLADARKELEELANRSLVVQQELTGIEEAISSFRQTLQATTEELGAQADQSRATLQALQQDGATATARMAEIESGLLAIQEEFLQTEGAVRELHQRLKEHKVQLGITVNPEAVVVAVLPETPAAKAGLRPGDVVLGVNNVPVKSSEDLLSALHQAEPGQEVQLTVGRGADKEEVKIQLAESPS